MASQGTLASLSRSLSLLRLSTCTCLRPLILPPSSARTFSTDSARHERQPGAPCKLPTAHIISSHPSLPRSAGNDSRQNQIRHTSTSFRSRSSTFAKRPRSAAPLPLADSTAERTSDAPTAARLAQRRQNKEESRLRRDADAWAEAFKLRDAGEGPAAKEAAATTVSPKKDKEKALPAWKKHKVALQTKFPAGWAPPKRISREAMDLLRTLARSEPGRYTTPVLAAKFKISPEAVSKILRSRFALPAEERERREAKRKEARAKGIREENAAGMKPDEGETQGEEQVWEGDLGAQRREMEELRRRREQEKERERDPVLDGW
ncbi:hypothetical protein JCM11251_001708 [Rhodosporidiobolus azoricus]